MISYEEGSYPLQSFIVLLLSDDPERITIILEDRLYHPETITVIFKAGLIDVPDGCPERR